MKRIITLLVAAVMVMGAASLAGAAVQFKTSGHMHINFSLLDNATGTAKWNSDEPEDNFIAGQRFRPKLTMQANGVTGVFEAQQQQAIWGNQFDVNHSKNMDIRIRQAYLDFKLPSTPVSIKAGYQQLNLPGIWRNPVFESRVGAVVASVPFNDQVSLAAFWARPYVDVAATPTTTATYQTDFGGAMLPLNFGTAKVTPYVVYANVGVGTSTSDTLIVGGANVQVMPMDALSVKVDGIATSYNSDEDTRDTGLGFMLAAAVDYKMAWGTPGVFLWYATGADDEGKGAFRSVATDGFAPSSWGFKGSNTWGYDATINSTGISTSALGAQVAGLSFVDGLKHTARVLYIMGTADEDNKTATGTSLTTKDFYIEGNFDSNWSIYENLAAVLELGIILPNMDHADAPNDPAMKAQLTLRFSF